MELVIVERIFPTPIDPAQLRATVENNQGCLDLHGVHYLRSYVSSDGLRVVCLFEAPDAESVRIVNRQVGMPYERIWTATIHDPSQ